MKVVAIKKMELPPVRVAEGEREFRVVRISITSGGGSKKKNSHNVDDFQSLELGLAVRDFVQSSRQPEHGE